jgi:hypothetical protein
MDVIRAFQSISPGYAIAGLPQRRDTAMGEKYGATASGS